MLLFTHYGKYEYLSTNEISPQDFEDEPKRFWQDDWPYSNIVIND